MSRLHARTQPLKQSYHIGKSTNTSIPWKRYRISLSNVAGKPRIQTTIVKDVAVGTNIARITLLAATKRNNPKSI
jgi:hypothetical protein